MKEVPEEGEGIVEHQEQIGLRLPPKVKGCGTVKLVSGSTDILFNWKTYGRNIGYMPETEALGKSS